MLQIFPIPIEVATAAIDKEARPLQPVELTRKDDELRGDASALQCLVHLFTIEEGNVEVLVARQEQSRRRDSIDVEKWV